MKITRLLSISLFITLFCFEVNAQRTTQTTQNCACCDSTYTNFDFWEGKWIVKDSLGNKLGKNTIKKIESNCVLQEHWQGEKGGTGTSINYYNKSDSLWHQTWVSSTGNVLELSGNLTDDKMILKSGIIEGRQGQYYNQISWIPNDDGTVTQIWEIFSVDGV